MRPAITFLNIQLSNSRVFITIVIRKNARRFLFDFLENKKYNNA